MCRSKFEGSVRIGPFIEFMVISMKIHSSGEDYLEAILIIKNKKGYVRSIDVAGFLNYSKPSVSHAVSILRDGGFLDVDENGYLNLTESGREVAEKIYERHLFFKNRLIEAGVDEKTAEEEACKIEHDISDDTFEKLKSFSADHP